jgi:hypothetical protein
MTAMIIYNLWQLVDMMLANEDCGEGLTDIG